MNKLGKFYYKILTPRFSSVEVSELKNKKPPCFILLATLQDFIAKRRKVFNNNYYFGHFVYLLTNGLQIQFRVALYLTRVWDFQIHQF